MFIQNCLSIPEIMFFSNFMPMLDIIILLLLLYYIARLLLTGMMMPFIMPYVML